MKCNYILKSDSILSLPLIGDINDIEYLKNYLNDINNLCEKYDDDDNIDGKLINSLENIFENTHLNINISNDSFLDEKYLINDPENDVINVIKNELFYFINIIPKKNLELDSNICDNIINKICDILSTDKKKYICII
jgi:hypothetical protein